MARENDPSIEDSREALGVVQQLWDFVLDRLPAQLGDMKSDT